MKPRFVVFCLALGVNLHAGDLQDVGCVNLVDVAAQWEILVPGYDYSGRSVLVRTELENSCFESGEQALRLFLAWVEREKQHCILPAADLRGWRDGDGSCIVSIRGSGLSGEPGDGLYIYRCGSPPTELGERLFASEGSGFGDSYKLEPIVVDKTITGLLILESWRFGTCAMSLMSLDGVGSSYPGYSEVSGDIGDPVSIVRVEEGGSTTYRVLTIGTVRLVDGLSRREPSLVLYEIGAKITEVERLRLVPKTLGEDAARQLASVRALVDSSTTAKTGAVAREILRCEPDRQGAGLGSLTGILENRSHLQEEPDGYDILQ